jgi:hypothetical protein
MKSIKTLGELKASGYQTKSVKEELRANLMAALKAGKQTFEGIHGYENTVIPELERAILAKHNINLLGLRGQAKTRLARLMVNLLDEWMPIVQGSEVNDDPLAPLSRYAKDLITEKGDETPITWVHREDRFAEKLATPDVTIADLIGDVDPIKAANMKLSYADERVIHFGMIPRANRCIFVINELPDLQARIQVALFNILQEGDIPWVSIAFSIGYSIRLYGKPGRLYQSRKYCNAAERPHRLADTDTLPGNHSDRKNDYRTGSKTRRRSKRKHYGSRPGYGPDRANRIRSTRQRVH